VVTKPCRLARSVADLCAIVKLIEAKGASLRILSMGVDTSTPTGRLMLNVLSSVAQFEREVMLERQREGMRKAKNEGRYKGRAPTARAKSEEIVKLAGEGWTREKIAGELGVGVASVYRVLRERRSPYIEKLGGIAQAAGRIAESLPHMLGGYGLIHWPDPGATSERARVRWTAEAWARTVLPGYADHRRIVRGAGRGAGLWAARVPSAHGRLSGHESSGNGCPTMQ
jgi:transcriptional regulator with XRE-family HTH domain